MDTRPYSAEGGQTELTVDTIESEIFTPAQIREMYTPSPHKDQNGGLPEENGLRSAESRMHNIGVRPDSSPSTYALPQTARTDNPSTAPPESLAQMLRRGLVDHQLGLSINLILLVSLSWLLFPSLRERMEAFSTLSYPRGNGKYGQGPKDLQLVLSLVVLFTAMRAFCLDYLLKPLASFLGIRRQKPRVRFAEQSYLLLYYCIYWTWGLQIMIKDTPSSLPNSQLNVQNFLISLWTAFPRLDIELAMKLYYLSQLAFWMQQILVIHVEEKRKDHYQMLTHHVVTVALLMTSYGYRQCRVGNAVLICMDIVDLIFPVRTTLERTRPSATPY